MENSKDSLIEAMQKRADAVENWVPGTQVIPLDEVLWEIKQYQMQQENWEQKYNDLLQSSKDFMKESGKYEDSMEGILNQRTDILNKLIYIHHDHAPGYSQWWVMLNLGSAVVERKHSVIIQRFGMKEDAEALRNAILRQHQADTNVGQAKQQPELSGTLIQSLEAVKSVYIGTNEAIAAHSMAIDVAIALLRQNGVSSEISVLTKEQLRNKLLEAAKSVPIGVDYRDSVKIDKMVDALLPYMKQDKYSFAQNSMMPYSGWQLRIDDTGIAHHEPASTPMREIGKLSNTDTEYCRIWNEAMDYAAEVRKPDEGWDLISRLNVYKDMLTSDDNKYIAERCIAIAESHLKGEFPSTDVKKHIPKNKEEFSAMLMQEYGYSKKLSDLIAGDVAGYGAFNNSTDEPDLRQICSDCGRRSKPMIRKIRRDYINDLMRLGYGTSPGQVINYLEGQNP